MPSQATSDAIISTDNKMLSNPSPQGFLKPFSYLFYTMDVQIMTTPPIPSIGDTPTPSPGNMNFSTGRAIL